MPTLSLFEVAEAVGGELIQGDGSSCVTHYHFDSREARERTLFFALTTGQVDGHRFLDQVAQHEGAAAVVSRDVDPSSAPLPLIRVDDTTLAYQELARAVRRQFAHVRYVGITGSAGKTTTKELSYQLLASRFRAYRSPGNWNNWLGLPFALLQMPDDTEVGVFELAMSDPGIDEIDFLAEILRPDVTCLLNALPTHLEFLKTVENVARGKLQIHNYLESDGVALVLGDDPYLARRCRHLPGRKIFFGRDPATCDVTVLDRRSEEEGEVLTMDFHGRERNFAIPPLTDTQVDNLAAAMLIAEQVGMKHDQIAESLGSLDTVGGRGGVSVHGGVTVVDDTYNSNPAAVLRLLAWGARTPAGQRIAVLGDMLELGETERDHHREVGAAVARLGFDRLVAVGERARDMASSALSQGMDASSVVTVGEAHEVVDCLEAVEPGALVLFKGSRGIGLEVALNALVAKLDDAAGSTES